MKVIIMRGIPGSGKSTQAQRWAKLVPGTVIVSADTYMYAGGQEFADSRLSWCHEQCQAEYTRALEAKAPLVIVDNTNSKFSDIVFYVTEAERHGYEFMVLQINIEPRIAAERCVHKAPLKTVELFARRLWSERLPSTWDVWNQGVPWRPPRKSSGEASRS